MAAILSSWFFFYRKLCRKLNIPKRKPWTFPTFWAFDRRCNSNIDGDIIISRFDPFSDLVTSSMTSWIYIYMIVVTISWYICIGKLNDDIFARCLVIMKNVISFIKENRGPWNITCTTRHSQQCTCKILFVWHQSFIVKLSGKHRDKDTNKQTNTHGENIIILSPR